MKFMQSLLEAAKEQQTHSAADLRAYMGQIRTTFDGNKDFKEGKIKRGQFVSAALDVVDNCPKMGEAGESAKSACVNALWKQYQAKYTKPAGAAVEEAVNHMGEKEQTTYSGWKRACKAAYPGCTFRGDKDIGAAVLDGKDVGEWDGEKGSVYKKDLKEFDDIDFRQEQQAQDSFDDESPLYIQVSENHAFRIEGAHAGQYSEVLKQFAMTLGKGNFQEGQQALAAFQKKTGYPNQMRGSRRIHEENGQMVFDTLTKEQAAKEFRGIVWDAGGLSEGWDSNVSDEDRDVKIADQEAKKRKIKMMSKEDEDAVKKNLERQDQKAEDKAAKKAAKTKLDEDFNGSDEADDVKRAEDEARKRKIKMMSPRAEKILHKRTDRLDKRDENSGAKKVADLKEEQQVETKSTYQPTEKGFLQFLKAKE